MINGVVLIGSLGDSVTDNMRILLVEREYKDNDGVFNVDEIKLRFWTKSKNSTFMKIKNGARIAIRGRLETEDEFGTIVVVESYNYLSINNF